MDESPADSPTGLYYSRPADILCSRYRRGNSESVRQLSVRVRIAEERASKYKRENAELKFEKERLAREIEENRNAQISTRKDCQAKIEDLERQVRELKSKGSNTRVQELMDLFDASSDSKCLAPPYYVSDAICFDASVGTEPEAWEAKQKFHDQAVSTDNGDHYGPKDDFEERAELEAAKFNLETQLKLARGKLEHFNLQQIQKELLEKRVLALTETIDRLLAENETLKTLTTRSLSDSSGSKSESRKVVDITLEYQSKLNSKIGELELKTKQLEELTRMHNVALTSLEALRERCTLLEEENAKVSAQLPIEVDPAVQEELRKFQEENLRLKELLSKYEKPSASDTTTILHLRMNPLEVAHQEYKDFETSRKRKAEVSMLCDADGLDASVRKKQIEELQKQIADLQFQLHKVANEKDRAYEIQRGLIKQYRAIVLTLFGWQIKMKDDGFAEVESVLNPGRFFFFKVEKLGTSVSLLETDYANEWTEQIHEYLELRDSVPSFLASVTLALNERLHCA